MDPLDFWPLFWVPPLLQLSSLLVKYNAKIQVSLRCHLLLECDSVVMMAEATEVKIPDTDGA